MKFSIIIPVYNVEPYLEKCLDSVINQTYKNFEVIIVNDSSPDNSQKIIDKYVKKDKRFKGYIKENGGVSSVRNYGLQKVSGDYILFLDGDDYIDISLLEELSKKIANQYPDIVRFSLSTVTEKNELIKEIPIKETDNTKEEAIDEIVKNSRRVHITPGVPVKYHLCHLVIQIFPKIVRRDDALDLIKQLRIFNQPGKQQPLGLPGPVLFFLLPLSRCEFFPRLRLLRSRNDSAA